MGDFSPTPLQARYHGLGSIVPEEPPPVNAGKQLRLAMERGIRVVIKYKSPGARHGVQTAPVEIDEVQTTAGSAQPKVIFYSGIKDRKKAVELSKVTAIHPVMLDECEDAGC